MKLPKRGESSPHASRQDDLAAVPPPALLICALDQTEQVKGKVEQCASDLASVNTVLRQEIADEAQLKEAAHAITLSEKIEIKVQQCAEQLATVNDALSEEIEERKTLDQALSTSNAALLESQEQEEKAMRLALHDAVTGLPNLPLFNDRFGQALAQAEREGQRLAVMFIDLDKFKGINDTHGHHIGDGVLQTVGQRLQAMVRAGDTVSRRSGDEFLYLMLDASDENDAVKLAVKMIDRIAHACEVEDVKLTVKPSIGIAFYPEHGQSPQEVLKNADLAMYAAKKSAQGYSIFSVAPNDPTKAG